MGVWVSRGRFERCAACAGLAILSPASPSAATEASSVDLVLEGTISARCEFIGAPQQLIISEPALSAANGSLGFACNLPQAQPVNLTISSRNGALQRDSADAGLPYAISWQVGGETPVQDFQPSPQPASFPLLAAPAGTQKSGTLTVSLLQSLQNAEAGTYSDQITISLSP